MRRNFMITVLITHLLSNNNYLPPPPPKKKPNGDCAYEMLTLI